MKDLLVFRTFVLVRKGIHQMKFFHAPALIALCNEKLLTAPPKGYDHSNIFHHPLKYPPPMIFLINRRVLIFFRKNIVLRAWFLSTESTV